MRVSLAAKEMVWGLTSHSLAANYRKYEMPSWRNGKGPLKVCVSILDKFRFPAISSGQLEVDFTSDQVGDRDEIA